MEKERDIVLRCTCIHLFLYSRILCGFIYVKLDGKPQYNSILSTKQSLFVSNIDEENIAIKLKQLKFLLNYRILHLHINKDSLIKDMSWINFQLTVNYPPALLITKYTGCMCFYNEI